MVKVFGDYSEPATYQSQVYLRLAFPARSLAGRWKNVGLSASYLAAFFETFFQTVEGCPATATPPYAREIESSINYIANELIENAVKFNVDDSVEIGLAIYYRNDELIFLVWNSVDTSCARRLQALIREISYSDVEELLIRRMEESYLAQTTSSGLGLLTIMHDHGARLGWRFESLAGKRHLKLLTTMVSLPLSRTGELVEV